MPIIANNMLGNGGHCLQVRMHLHYTKIHTNTPTREHHSNTIESKTNNSYFTYSTFTALRTRAHVGNEIMCGYFCWDAAPATEQCVSYVMWLQNNTEESDSSAPRLAAVYTFRCTIQSVTASVRKVSQLTHKHTHPYIWICVCALANFPVGIWRCGQIDRKLNCHFQNALYWYKLRLNYMPATSNKQSIIVCVEHIVCVNL